MSQHTRRMRYWQGLTLGLLVTGYAGYYLCRSNLSVALPLIIDDLDAHGLSHDQVTIQLGTLVSLGVLGYSAGKFLSGALADIFGGRRNFLLGMMGSIFFTIAFALGGAIPIFTLSWIANRLVQSLGWAGLVKITSKWFSFSTYGTVMGAMSLSYLFGDAAARQFMGMLIARGFDWRSVFWAGASILFVLLIVNLWLLKESPTQIGQPEPAASPLSLFASSGMEAVPSSLRALLAPLFGSPAFWLVCLLSLGCTLVRETFNTWTPTYFTQVVGLSNARAAKMSGLFPLFGGVSVLLAGYLIDVLGRQGRATVIVGGLLLAALALFALG